MQKNKRLAAIDNMITGEYLSIWDCCCDHGLLGMQLLKRNAAQTIHFVDLVPNIISKLNQQLCRFFPINQKQHITPWFIHCADMNNFANLFLNQINTQSVNNEHKHIIIIAGVGGDKVTEWLQQICQQLNNSKINVEFLLCPIHHHYKLRSALAALNLRLINETLIEENQRFYEIIHVSNQTDKLGAPLPTIAPVGSIMWQLNQQSHQRYITNTILHYQRMAQNNNPEVRHIIAAYQALI